MPFDCIKAMSQNPQLARWACALGCWLFLSALAQHSAIAQDAAKTSETAVAAPATKVEATSIASPAPEAAAKSPAEAAPKPAPLSAATNAGNSAAVAAPTTPAPAAPPAKATATATAPASAVPASNAPAPNSFEAFRLIADRNIFNPNRTRGSRGGQTEERRPPRVESFALVGTMSYGKGTFAFFDSGSASLRKTLKAGDAIATYTLKEIANNHVKLEADGKEIELKVGMQLKREDEGEWQVSARPETIASAPRAPETGSTARNGESGGDGSPRSDDSSRNRFSRASSRSPSREGGNDSASTSTSPAPPPGTAAPSGGDSGGGGGANELLRRLMEQRQRELNR